MPPNNLRLGRRDAFTRPEFQYQPLQSDHVRILTIEPGPRSAPIRCTFQTVALAGSKNSVGFTALSYSWGPTKEPKTIVVQGGQLQVQPNAFDLLVAVRSDTESRSVWIDSVCINQANTAEKTVQVRLMGQIYTSAARVLIWLGGHTDDSKYAMESIHRHNIENFVTAPFARGMLEILDRPWFQRTWIIQEFVLNRRAPVISCGFTPPVCWGCFMAAYTTAFPFSRGSESVTPGQTPASVRELDLDKWRKYYRTLEMLDSLRNGVQKHAPDPAHYDLVYLLYATRPFLATDPRDKIYGVLAMAHKDTQAHPLIRPDYGKSVEQVFRDATIYLLKEARAVKEGSEPQQMPDGTTVRPQTEEAQTTAFYSVIALRQPDSLNLGSSPRWPSWVPDFSTSRYGFPSAPWLYDGELKDFPPHRREDVHLCSCGRGLAVKGWVLDRVKDFVQAPSVPCQHLPAHAYPQIALLTLLSLPFYLITLGRSVPPQMAPEITRYRAMLLKEAETLLRVAALAEQAAVHVSPTEPLWKTLLLSLAVNDEYRDEEQCGAMFAATMDMARDFVATQRPDAWWIARPRLVAFFNHIAANPVAKGIRLAFCAGRSFFIGESGMYYGVGEGELRAGDIVALLFPDANRPYILRRVGENYEMVGGAYLPEPVRTRAIKEGGEALEEITIV